MEILYIILTVFFQTEGVFEGRSWKPGLSQPCMHSLSVSYDFVWICLNLSDLTEVASDWKSEYYIIIE